MVKMSEPATRLPDRRVVVEVIDDATAAMYRAMTPAQRVAAASAMHRAARLTLSAVVRQLHPDWPPPAVHREVLRRLLGHGASGLLEALG
jgi:hypothetical protein